MAERGDMRKAVLAGLLTTVVLVGAGLSALFLRPRGPEQAAAPAAPDATGSTALASAAPPPDAEAPAPPAEREAVVANVVGKVERLRGADWNPVKVGDTVKAEDSLRTAPAARADLEIGEASRLTVSEDTQVKVAELTAAVHRFKIKRGRVAAAYQADGARVLRIEGEGGEAVAEAKEASFSVRATDTTFAVATEVGTVNLKAKGGEVAVPAGQLSVAAGSGTPSPAAPIPAAILLKVAAAATVAKAEPCSVVEGDATPGSDVQVDGQPATVDPQGHFRAALEAGKARREVLVVMRDLLGNTREEKIACAPTRRGDAGSQQIEKMKIRWE
ncbi:MAG: FecR domain-containing protein [Myxococcales bacterium]